ncbi:hydrogenase maturation nickel metallochaperone HypA [Brevibacillus ginsengisoli]|uniref:hydrogenase maturation nickel metallochaperone HypA/HybF n=1 Tax=Brevibacillus ginsengisoli TaxID=363854 RepID=UPI003CEE189D
MHEMSLMESTLTMVRDLASKEQMTRITEVCLGVGELSGAMPDALRFAFEALTKVDTYAMFRGATLTIQWEEAVALCSNCGASYHPDRKILLCPECSLPTGKLIQGENLQVLYFEGE